MDLRAKMQEIDQQRKLSIEKLMIDVLKGKGSIPAKELSILLGIGSWTLVNIAKKSKNLMVKRKHTPTAKNPNAKTNTIFLVNHCPHCGGRLDVQATHG